ncbi:uncharacterized protein LOC127286948 [Leptopilina boulardi]|uniref:uncharacterized protein LOC127286948 n=1 Tax=Leptopilina boulardi TaxID=63433 RepID=UPI0021F618C3|nr:uncharacterized protein LOC127286948 [Leptopilina boulardi]
MKNIAFFLGVLLLAVAGGNCQMNDYPEALKIVLENCLNKFDISKEEYMTALKNNDYSTNSKNRCLRECLMTDSGIMKDGEIKIEKIKELMVSYNPTISEADIDSTHAKCVTEAQQKTDKCDMAQEYGKCVDAVFMKA